MSLLRRSRRRGMVVGAAIGSSRANKRHAAQQSQATSPQAVTPAQPTSTDDVIEQVKKLAQLRDQGILTDAEFEAKKKQLLNL